MSTPYRQDDYRRDYLPYGDPFAALAQADERSTFITKTYLNLAGAIFMLVALEFLYFALGMQQFGLMLMGGTVSWLIVIGLFLFVSHIANSWALNATDVKIQYAGLGLYVVAQSILLFSMLCVVFVLVKDHAVAVQMIGTAAGATLGLFGLMTGVVFFTRKDFSFLRSILWFGSLAALGYVVVSLISGWSIGTIFTYLMIAMACGYILYHTSNVMHHYHTTQHAAAALALFASVVLLFWYVLRLLLILYSSRE